MSNDVIGQNYFTNSLYGVNFLEVCIEINAPFRFIQQLISTFKIIILVEAIKKNSVNSISDEKNHFVQA